MPAGSLIFILITNRRQCMAEVFPKSAIDNYTVQKIAIAHVRQDENKEWVPPHRLEDHLRDVANLAGNMAKTFYSDDWATLAGLWHDLGKYRPAFQNYIRKVSGYDPEAHIEQGKGRVDHSTAGAIHAVNELKGIGRVLAYLIAGHHAGLPDWSAAEGGNAALECRLENGKKLGYLAEALAEPIPQDILKQKKPISKPPGGEEGLHLWIRMLFSCLVDADFLDTEAFMSPQKATKRASWLSLGDLKNRFDIYMRNKISKTTNTSVNIIRAEILQACRDASSQPSGIFTLTVPTGGGKTLSGMAFALEHSLKHNKQRIIVAIPYTSIIEQTADEYRSIFGDSVIEHHSNLDPEQENSKSRLASENWDAPIIVTTNVQLLESLFAARTSRCRKLHNLVNSVIIIDEAQLLPPEFLQPVLDILHLLTKYYGVTLVLSTATQPALSTIKNAFGHTTLRGLDHVQEIMPDVSSLYRTLSRVKVEKPNNLSERISWENLAQDLCKHDSVLVIVNTRKDCRALFDLMPEDTIHLSGLMCGEHRSRTINKIKHKLKMKESVRVVSTQLVEAGVDLDFPVVYRALAGLDSIAQAAGRCNREGQLEKGRVVVFVPPNSAPKGMLLQAEQATVSIWHNWNGDPLDHHLYSRYFEQYFNVENDKNGVISLLTKDARDCAIQFRTAAERFCIIDDKGIYQILVPYDENGQKYLDMLRANKEPARYLMRKLQRYSVNIYQNDFIKLREIGAVEEIQLGMGIYALSASAIYCDTTGLLGVDDILSKSNVF